MCIGGIGALLDTPRDVQFANFGNMVKVILSLMGGLECVSYPDFRRSTTAKFLGARIRDAWSKGLSLTLLSPCEVS